MVFCRRQAHGSIDSLQHPHILERLCRVTSLAVSTEFSIVHVVASMAFAASDRQLDHVHDGLPMTVIARNRNMRAIELEIRLQVVVEEPDPPIDRIMATLAGVAESAVMGLIFGMAIHAGGLDVFEYLRRVAGIAFFVNMFSE